MNYYPRSAEARYLRQEALDDHEFGMLHEKLQNLTLAIDQGGAEGACRIAGDITGLNKFNELVNDADFPGGAWMKVRQEGSNALDNPDFRHDAEQYAFNRRLDASFVPEDVTPETFYNVMSEKARKGTDRAQEFAGKFYNDVHQYWAIFAASRVGCADAVTPGHLQFYPPTRYGDYAVPIGQLDFSYEKREEAVTFFEEKGYRFDDQPPLITAIAQAYIRSTPNQKLKLVESGAFNKLREYFGIDDEIMAAIGISAPYKWTRKNIPIEPGNHAAHSEQARSEIVLPPKNQQIHIASIALQANAAHLKELDPELAPHVESTLARLKRMTETGADANPDVRLATNPVQARIIREALRFMRDREDVVKSELASRIIDQLGQE